MDTTSLPTDALGLLAVVFGLGLRHGLDPDHLAAIDSLTRSHLQSRGRFGKAIGALFAIGHGGVVVLMAVLVAAAARNWEPQPWLRSFGVWASVAILLSLGVSNLVALARAPADADVSPRGWRTAFFVRRLGVRSGGGAVAVGALFAVSFDTAALAVMFAFLGTRFGGWAAALGFAIVFVAGMLVTDGLNGVWVSRLVQGAGRRTLVASRVMALAIAAVAIATAGLGALSELSPAIGAWAEQRTTGLGITLIAAMSLAFVLAAWLGSPRRDAAANPR